ncbi:DUF5712 family protein, partial [Tenacibaculum finnmarkense]
KDQWKYVEVEYNPSQAEQKQIIESATGRTDVNEWKDLTKAEQQQVKEEFTQYVREAQDVQAQNYNRESIKNGSDLKYYGKIETQRRYKGDSKEVKQGTAKQGDLKAGLNMHCHIIQSRKAIDKKTKLAPTSKHRGQSSKSNIKQGFDRNEFYNKIEQKFDKKFNYNRDVKQTFEWKKANKLNRQDVKESLEKRHSQGKQQEQNRSRSEAIRNSPNRPHLHKEELRKQEQKKEQQKEVKKSNNKGYGY